MKKAKEKPATKKQIQKKKDEIGKMKKEEKENDDEKDGRVADEDDEKRKLAASPINRKAKEQKDQEESDEIDEESGKKVEKHERKGPGVLQSLKAKIGDKMSNFKEAVYSKIPNRPQMPTL